MIKAHEHVWPGRGKCLHVYSTENLEELFVWAREHSVPRSWLHEAPGNMPHFDLWGWQARRAEGIPFVDKREVVDDMKIWRKRHGDGRRQEVGGEGQGVPRGRPGGG